MGFIWLQPMESKKMKFNQYKALYFIALGIAMCGTSFAGCEDERGFIRDEKKRDELVRWADSEIFSRTFSEKDFRVAGMIGPGRNGANFSLERSGIKVPEWLSGYVIRAVGPDRFHPNVLFVGRFRYQGIIISRDEFVTSIAGTPLDISRLEELNGRLGLICYVD